MDKLMSSDLGEIKNVNQDRVAELQAEIAKLREEQANLQRTLEAMSSMVVRRMEKDNLSYRKLASRLGHLELTARDTAKVLRDLVKSRIWKTLTAAGWLMLRVLPETSEAQSEQTKLLTAAEKQERIQMRCDSFSVDSIDPVAGKIEITGWAISAEGIDRVEIRIENFPPLRVRFGLPRPDIEGLFPNSRNAAKSGFAAGFDTTDLPDGIYALKIRATTRKGLTRELNLPLLINQEMGLVGEYSRWVEVFEGRDPDLIRIQLSGLKYLPLVSVLVPVFRTNLDILKDTVNSVKAQSYENWELCLVDDGSGIPELTAFLEKEATRDSRIHVITRPERGGISAASNDALRMAKGTYVALLDHDDLLTEDALFHLISEIQGDDPPDLLYSDEDHIDESGRRFSPFFKPDWSPDLILSENYVTHLMMFRRDLALAVGGFRSEFDLSQDHDILLRMSEKAQSIVHVPKVLYHWRTSLESMSRASTAEDRAIASSRSVVESFVAGRATVEPGIHPGRWRVRYPVPEGTRVTIVIPTAGKTDILDRNLKALWDTAGYDNYEILIIDNSRGDSVIKFTDELRKKERPVKRFDQRGQPFNYSRLNNLAVADCDSQLFLFLNDDTEGISKGWLLAMAELAMRPEVGAVGAKLLYPNGLIQHAGVTMGLAEICGHSFKGLEGKQRHYYDFPDLIRNVSAVTAACVMIRADVFREVGGFDEKMFPIAYNDIDLTLKIGAAGYRVLYTPHALLYHYEAFSKSEAELHPHPAETFALKTKWKKVIDRDPFYNPNLTRHIENWSLRWD
jgi:GT2 family glycosyltransferase